MRRVHLVMMSEQVMESLSDKSLTKLDVVNYLLATAPEVCACARLWLRMRTDVCDRGGGRPMCQPGLPIVLRRR